MAPSNITNDDAIINSNTKGPDLVAQEEELKVDDIEKSNMK